MMRKTTAGRKKRGVRAAGKLAGSAPAVGSKRVSKRPRHKLKAGAPPQRPLPVSVADVEARDERHGMIEDAEMLPATRATLYDEDQIDWAEAEEDEAVPPPKRGR